MTTHDTGSKAPEKSAAATAPKPTPSDVPVFDPQPPSNPQERMAVAIFGNYTSPHAQAYLDALHDLMLNPVP
jgi:hypothetical protein